MCKNVRLGENAAGVMQLLTEEDAIDLLIRYYEEGDRNALGEFSAFYFPYIYRTAFYYVCNHDDAEDVCQQVFVLLLGEHNRCEGAYDREPTKMRTWLGIICANASRSFLRLKRNQAKKVKASSELGNFKTYANDNEENFEDEWILKAKEKLKKIGMAQDKAFKLQESNWEIRSEKSMGLFLGELLEVLPEKYRVPLLLRYKEELSFAEIADVMDCKEVTIRSHISRGIKYLRQQFAEHNMSITGIGILKLISEIDIKGASSDLLEKCLSVQLASPVKNSVVYETKSSAVKLFSFVGISFAIVCVLFYFYFPISFFSESPEKELLQNKVMSDAKDTNRPIDLVKKNTWDFSLDNGLDIQKEVGEWKWSKELKSLYSISEGRSKILFPYKYERPTKVTLKGYVPIQYKDDSIHCGFQANGGKSDLGSKIIYTNNINKGDRKFEIFHIEYFFLEEFILVIDVNTKAVFIYELANAKLGYNFACTTIHFNLNFVQFTDLNEEDKKNINALSITENLEPRLVSRLAILTK